MNNEEKGKIAFDLHQIIAGREMKRRELLFENMRDINRMYSEKLFRVFLGDENAQWSAYLGEHSVFYSRSKVFTMNRIYQRFIVELKIDVQRIAPIPLTKLANLLPVVDRKNVEDWLTKAETLTNQDLNDEIRIASGKESYLNCEHKEEQTYKVCAKCGNRHRI
jgi:hypothetical protein